MAGTVVAGTARLGVAGQGWARNRRHGSARLGLAWHGMESQAWLGVDSNVEARQAWHGSAWHGRQ